MVPETACGASDRMIEIGEGRIIPSRLDHHQADWKFTSRDEYWGTITLQLTIDLLFSRTLLANQGECATCVLAATGVAS